MCLVKMLALARCLQIVTKRTARDALIHEYPDMAFARMGAKEV